MAMLEKYHQTTEQFLTKLRDDDKDLCLVGGALYLYDKGAWRAVGQMLQDTLDRVLKKVCDDESFPYAEKYPSLWRNIKAELPVYDEEALDKRGWIALPNGTLDPVSGELHEHDADYLITRRAAIEYMPEAECPEWRKMLARCVEDKPQKDRDAYLLFLQMWFGLALVGFRKYSSRALRKMLILSGPPGTAKSTIADTARYILGKDNIAGDSVEQLSSRFGLETVFRSIAIVSDDASGFDTKVRAEVFKKLITGEPLSADRKGKNIVAFRFNGPILLTLNNLPRVRDATDALYGRSVVLDFNRVFTADDANEQLEGHGTALAFLIAKGEFPGILNWALEGLGMAREMGQLPDIASAKDAAEAWRGENDPVFAFLKEHTTFKKNVINFTLPVSAAISIYAEVQMGTREFPTQRVSQILGRNVANIVPGVKHGRKSVMKEQIRCYEGLMLRDSGLKFVQLARERGLLPVQWPVNEMMV